MIPRRKPVSADAQRKYRADEELAGRFEELLAGARDAEQELRDAEAAGAPLTERYRDVLAEPDIGQGLEFTLGIESSARIGGNASVASDLSLCVFAIQPGHNPRWDF